MPKGKAAPKKIQKIEPVRIAKVDPVALAQSLIRKPSITPKDAGAIGVVEKALEKLGFHCQRLKFVEEDIPAVENLYARIGAKGSNFCFAGHTDVVPPGDESAWAYPPFSATIDDERLFGRGAEDMKGAIAAMVAGTSAFLHKHGRIFKGSISFLITGDEEGIAINGTRKVLEWMEKKREKIDACVVGEPTNPTELGQMIKIGRRGSMTTHLTVYGTQGHVAYPHLADNPITRLLKVLIDLKGTILDEGSDYFQPSNLEITNISIENGADNVIPGSATATFNIRFNDRHDSDTLKDWITEICEHEGGQFELYFRVSGEPFLTEPGDLSTIVSQAVREITGKTPELSTTGGTSDARFIKDLCPVVEFGTTGATAHKVDENVKVDDLRKLAEIYEKILEKFFALG